MASINLNCLTLENVDLNNIIERGNIEETYFYSTLSFIMETRNQYMKYNKEFYRNITECTNYVMLNESFSDFYTKVKSLIDKFIQFIKSLFKRFVTALNKFIKSDKYILKHKKDLQLFDQNDEFIYKGYTFTFDPTIPVVDPLAQYNGEFIGLTDKDLLKMDDKDLIKHLADKRAKLASELDGDYYDLLRGDILGLVDTKIDESDFQDELFSVFRNGADSPLSLSIDNTKIYDAMVQFEGAEKLIKDVKKLRDKIEKDYLVIKKKIENIISVNKDKNIADTGYIVDDDYNAITNKRITASDQIISQIDMYIKLKASQVEKMSAMHALAFSSKIDAINASVKQNREILYKALSTVQKNHKGGN